ncbi:MAG: VTT domain-containing protein [candidate division SR1 bacterium]|nr:VTT domain-containing protein [candidate division SR1 bacterium]
MNIKDYILYFGNFGYLFIYIILFAIVFAESGLFVGALLPGDSLLFTAGILAAEEYINIYVLLIVFAIAAIAGDSFGYYFGRKVGKKLFNKPDSKFFHKDNLLIAEKFYEKHGKITVILARFIPIVRTFAPIVAGISNMSYSIFIFYNVIGGIIWSSGITLAGYFLGKLIPDIDKYLLPFIIGIIVITILPTIFHFRKESKKSNIDKFL